MAAPPPAWMVRREAPAWVAERTAPATVLGMSWSLRSRKTLKPRSRRCCDDAVAGGVVELHADLEPLAGVAEAVDECQGLAFVGEVQRYGEVIFGVQGFGLALGSMIQFNGFQCQIQKAPSLQ